MLSSIVEGFLQRFCGRYLKNFGPQNVSVSVTGTITLTNVQIRTEELINFQLPYKPVRAFIGSLHLDLPLVVSTSFDVRLSDVLIVVERNAENVAMDAATAHKALQMWIGAFYFALLHAESLKQNITSNELEYSLRLLDRLAVTITGVHIRVEDTFTAHLPSPLGRELMALGVIIGHFSFRSPTSSEIEDSEVWSHPSSPASLVVNKYIESDNFTVYCSREERLGNVTDEELTLELVRSHCYMRKAGTIFGPSGLRASASATFNKSTQFFNPVIVHATPHGLDVRCSDEQVAFLTEFSVLFDRNVNALQSKSRAGLVEVSISSLPSSVSSSAAAHPDVRRRARYRWSLIRDSIKVDWWRYSSTLRGGRMRWRAWFDTWRQVARYIALREILIYHVGFEAVENGPDSVSYSVNESLRQDHSSSRPGAAAGAGGAAASASTDGSALVSEGGYLGRGAFSQDAVNVAEAWVRHQLRHQGEGSNPRRIRASTIRALYALQLEMDALLPIRVSAQARLWAEEKYRLLRLAQQRESLNETSQSTGSDEEAPHSVSLLVAVVDAGNLAGSFGMSRVEAQVSVVASAAWDACTSTDADTPVEAGPPGKSATSGTSYVTETATGKVLAGADVALVGWSDVFTLSCPPNPGAGTGSRPAALRVECNAKGMFAPSFGRATVPFSLLVPPGFSRDALAAEAEASPTGTAETPVLTLHIPLLRPQASFFGGDASTEQQLTVTAAQTHQPHETQTSVRILVTAVAGSQAAYQAAFTRLQEQAKQAADARRDVALRAAKMALLEGEDDEDVAFVLDPSKLTLQNMHCKLHIPSISVCLSALYVVPPSLRQQPSGRGLAHSLPVALVVVHVKSVSVSARADNNPWAVECQGSVGSVRVFMQPPSASPSSSLSSTANEAASVDQESSHQQQKQQQKAPLPLVALPKVSFTLSLTQVSTASRMPTLAGGLDTTCFDIKATLQCGFLTLTLHPHSFGPAQGGANKLIWEAFRPLHHLWADEAKWSRGSSNNTAGDSEGVAAQPLRAEAAIRLGDAYTRHPRRVNVIERVLAGLKHRYAGGHVEPHHQSGGILEAISNAASSHPSHPSVLQAALLKAQNEAEAPPEPLPEQSTSLTFATQSRALEVAIALQADPSVLALAARIERDEGWLPPDDGGDGAAYDDSTDESGGGEVGTLQGKKASTLNSVVTNAGKATAVVTTGVFNILTLGGILPSAIEATTGTADGASAAAGAGAGSGAGDGALSLLRRRWASEKAQLEARIGELEAALAQAQRK